MAIVQSTHERDEGLEFRLWRNWRNNLSGIYADVVWYYDILPFLSEKEKDDEEVLVCGGYQFLLWRYVKSEFLERYDFQPHNLKSCITFANNVKPEWLKTDINMHILDERDIPSLNRFKK